MAEEYISPDALTGLYGGDTTSSPNIFGLFSPYKKLFEKITSGNAGATEYAAAAGILGLLVPSLNKPQTPGWKGSIDLNKQYTRTPIAQPAYTPYAQSASPVMGRQFFNTTYGAAPVAAPTPAPAAPDTQTVNPDLASPSSTGGLARGGIANLYKFARGGRAEQPNINGDEFVNRSTQKTSPQIRVSNFGDEGGWGFGPGYHVGDDGVAKSSYIFVQRGNDAVVSDEIFWNPHSPIGEELQDRVKKAQDEGKRAGIVVTPYAMFQGKATNEQLLDEIKKSNADFVILDPYYVGSGPSTQELFDWTKNFTNDIVNLGKEVKLATQGFAPKGAEQEVLNYNQQLLSIPGINEFANLGWEDAADVMQNPAFVNLNNDFPKDQKFLNSSKVNQPISPQQPIEAVTQTDQQVKENITQSFQQPQQDVVDYAGSLPSGWSGYGAEQKIDWFNQNKVTPDKLLSAGMTQGDIDWMRSQGYMGAYEPQEPVLTATSQTDYLQSLIDPRRTIQEEHKIQQPAPTGITQVLPQTVAAPSQPILAPITQPMTTPIAPPIPQPMQEPMSQPFRLEQPMLEQVEAAQGGLMGLARGGRAMPPRYLRGQTDGMADRIPSNIDGVQTAKLSHGEFVIPADVVSHLGNGNSDAGAKVLYKMMDRVRQARTGNKKQGRKINPEKFTPGGIAGYAGGGAVAFQTGGTTTPTAPLGASTETNISEWAGPYVGDMLSKTAALTNTPYQAYQGPLVAGTAPLQSKVFGGLESLNFPGQLGQSFTAQGAYQLPSMTPGGVMGQATGPTGIASQYMNPYLSAVLTPQLDELRRQSQITQMGTAGKLAQAGAFGGSRQAIMDAETQRNLLAEQNKAIGTGYANAYDRAMGQFNVEQGQAKTLADMMADAGQQQRGIEQEGITALQKQYETELLDPYVKLRFQKEMLQGLPVQTVSNTANTSTMDQLKGGMSDIQSLMKALGLA